MKIECLKLDFCATKLWKKWKKEELGDKKTAFGTERNGLQALYIFISILK